MSGYLRLTAFFDLQILITFKDASKRILDKQTFETISIHLWYIITLKPLSFFRSRKKHSKIDATFVDTEGVHVCGH